MTNLALHHPRSTEMTGARFIIRTVPFHVLIKRRTVRGSDQGFKQDRTLVCARSVVVEVVIAAEKDGADGIAEIVCPDRYSPRADVVDPLRELLDRGRRERIGVTIPRVEIRAFVHPHPPHDVTSLTRTCYNVKSVQWMPVARFARNWWRVRPRYRSQTRGV